MYITRDIERLGVPALKFKMKKRSERSDVSAKAHGFSPDQETPVSEPPSSHLLQHCSCFYTLSEKTCISKQLPDITKLQVIH